MTRVNRSFAPKIFFTLVVLALLFCSAPNISAMPGPRSQNFTGTATVTNAVLTTSFGPAGLCITNQSATIDLYIDWTDGVAVAADNSTNLKILRSTTVCFTFANRNISNTISIGIITGSSTAAYVINTIGSW